MARMTCIFIRAGRTGTARHAAMRCIGAYGHEGFAQAAGARSGLWPRRTARDGGARKRRLSTVCWADPTPWTVPPRAALRLRQTFLQIVKHVGSAGRAMITNWLGTVLVATVPTNLDNSGRLQTGVGQVNCRPRLA
jgi:hypothetical protein